MSEQEQEQPPKYPNLHVGGIPMTSPNVEVYEREIERLESDNARLRQELEETKAALRERASSFHDYIRRSAEGITATLHTGADGDPRFEKCVHPDCVAVRAALRESA